MFSFTFSWRPSQIWKDFGITWLGMMAVTSMIISVCIVLIDFLSLFVKARPEAMTFLNSPRGWSILTLVAGALLVFCALVDLTLDEGEQRRNHVEFHRRNIGRFNLVSFYFWTVPNWIIKRVRRKAV